MKRSRLITAIAVSGIVALALAGCGTGNGQGTESDGGDAVTLGFVGPITGPNAEVGADTSQGIELAIAQANDAGMPKGMSLELSIEDDASNSTTGVSAFQKVTTEDGATAVLGPFNSNVAAAVATQADRSGVPLMVAGATADSLLDQGYETFFRPNNGNRGQAELFTTWLVEELGWKKIAFVYQETDYGTGLLETTKSILEDLGGEIVDEISYPAETTNFLTIATRLKGLEFDGIVTASLVSEMAPMLRNANQAGIPSDKFAGYADPIQLVENAGENADGVYAGMPFDTKSTDVPEAVEFTKAYEEEYGELPTIYAAQGYNAAVVLIEAIRDAESGDSAAILEALSSEDFAAEGSPFGTVSFDERGQATNPILIQQITDGTAETVAVARPQK